ncbi:outer membrane beta-barrel protein [Fusobacterium sp. MFO224]|uniref:outer membrane beta-barrel protein n=1 Tax=Fusobacterium sp. MFO224 TaxID=3378070 RepID=UPI003853FA92
MKKVLIGLLALSAISFAAQENTYLNVRVGGDLGAEYTKIYSGDVPILNNETKDFGGEIALEGYKTITDNFDLGLGLAYQFHSDRKEKSNGIIYENNSISNYGTIVGEGGDYNSIPLYLVAKYNFNTNSEIKPYLKANLGYSFNINSSDATVKLVEEGKTEKVGTKIEDGLYWAFGGGIEYNDFTLDLMYAINKADMKVEGEKFKNDYERVVLSLGYVFNL